MIQHSVKLNQNFVLRAKLHDITYVKRVSSITRKKMLVKNLRICHVAGAPPSHMAGWESWFWDALKKRVNAWQIYSISLNSGKLLWWWGGKEKWVGCPNKSNPTLITFRGHLSHWLRTEPAKWQAKFGQLLTYPGLRKYQIKTPCSMVVELRLCAPMPFICHNF